MNATHIWVYGPHAPTRLFHLIASVSDETSDQAGHVGTATTVCNSYPRYLFETSIEPPDFLELCDKCALHDFEAWVVYRCFDADGAALYVGVTKNIQTRMAQHRSCRHYSDRWIPLLARIETEVFYNCYQAGAAERAAIAELQPRFNAYGRRRAVAA